MPPRILQMKVGVPIMMLQNINQPELCNSTRLAVQKLMSNITEATLLTGPFNDEDALIPRISMIPTVKKSALQAITKTRALSALISSEQSYLRMSQQRDLPESMAWRVIGKLESGQTQRSVADAVGVARSVVARQWNRFQETGNVRRRPGAGRPRATTSTDDRYIQLTARRNRTENATQLQRQLLLAKGRRVLKGCPKQYEDNARPHRARLVENMLEAETIQRIEWPACSPDLNPIKHVWDMLGRRIAARPRPPATVRDLEIALLEEWNSIPQSLIDNLIASMANRCAAVLAVRGDHTPY
ncbi:uncharacterized protein TNCV_3426641 [Trichonephila clavipes]|nr:uncharacterized protein TNCV_3426641 [Trichonephila clavipes]